MKPISHKIETLDEKWQVAVDLYTTDYNLVGFGLPSPELGRQYCIGLVVRAHRLFLVGDVVIVQRMNGDRRQPMYGITGKGYRLNGCYVSHEVMSYQKGEKAFVVPGTVRIVEHPSELTGLSPDHSDVRRFAVDLMRKVSANRVGAGSPAFVSA
jgi:hypothetical protein